MAKKLLVRTPVTTDGVSLVYDENKQPVYRSSIVELAARKGLESINATLPKVLRHEFEVVEVEEDAKSASNEDLKAKLADLEQQEEKAKLERRIEELEAKLSGQSGAAGDSTVTDEKLKAADVVAKIQAAETVAQVEDLAKDDTRKTVQDAAAKRTAELTRPS
jgi:BMFP domain-containing protein YqiC